MAINNNTARLNEPQLLNNNQTGNTTNQAQTMNAATGFRNLGNQAQTNRNNLLAQATVGLQQQTNNAQNNNNTGGIGGIGAQANLRTGNARNSAVPAQTLAATVATTRSTNVQRQAVVDPWAVNLTPTQETLLRDLYVSDNYNQVPEGHTFSVRDWYYGSDNKLSIGDVLLVRDPQNNIVDYRFMSASDIYDINYRENLLTNIEQVGNGWGFTPDLVDLPGQELLPAQERYYWNGYNWGTETVLAQNDYWDIVERNGGKMMLQRQYNDAGMPIKASDAIRDVFNNPGQYAFDCATPMPLLNMKTTLDVIGEDDFNNQAGQLLFTSWYDAYDTSYFDGGYDITKVNTINAGEMTVNGRTNLDGEMAMFNPASGDKLILGGVYYFEKPGDNTTATQGWNTVYLGETPAGSHRFWATSIGSVDVNFRDGYVSTNEGNAFQDHYLGSASINSNINRLNTWDTDGSGYWRY